MTSLIPTKTADSVSFVDQPFFIVSSERSGTTLLRLMLDSHRDITWCHEFSYAVELVGDDGQWPDMESYYEYLQTLRVFASSGFSVDRTLDYGELVNSFLLQRMASSGKSIVGANVHHFTQRLPLVWPNARYIHLVRDGRDVAESMVRLGWYGSYWHAGRHWDRAERHWDDLSSAVPEDHQLEISYADMVLAPEVTLKKICAFMEVDYSDDFYAYTETTDYAPVERRHLGKWERALSDADVGLLEATMGDMLERRGLELSGKPIPVLTRADIRRLHWADRFGRIRARFSEFGVPLTVAEMVVRLGHIKPLKRRIRLRMNDIEARHLKKSW